MQGRIELRFIAPNTSKVRSRVENPSPELSGQIRTMIAEAVAEVAEASQFEIKAKILKRIAAKEQAGEIKFNNPQHRAQVFDLTSDIFATAFAPTKEAFEARFPSESKKADEGAEASKEKKEKPKNVAKPAKGESPANEPTDTQAPGDEFEE